MSTFFQKVPAAPAANGAFHGSQEGDKEPPWIMLPSDSPGLEVEFAGPKGTEPYCDTPGVVRLARTAAGRLLVRPVAPGSTTIHVRQGGANAKDGGRDEKLDVAVLVKREVKTAFFIVDAIVKGGGSKSNRNSSSVGKMLNEANAALLQPQTNVSVSAPYGAPAGLTMDVTRDTTLGDPRELMEYITVGAGIDYKQAAVRYAFCKRRRPEAHFTVFCVRSLADPEATLRDEQFCLVEDGDSAITDEVSYGAYCLAHAAGHLLRYKGGAGPHSTRVGDLMHEKMELGGVRISRDDAVTMNGGAGKLAPPPAGCQR